MRTFSEFRHQVKQALHPEPVQEDVASGDIALAGAAKVGPMDGPWAADDVEVGAHNVDDPAVLARVNAFVSAIGHKQYLNPYYALNRLWTQLQAIGLGFDLRAAKFDQPAGRIDLPLTQFGGRYGFTQMDGVVRQDDGISNRVPGGLALVLNYVNVNGITTLTGSIEHRPIIAGMLALGEQEAEGGGTIDEFNFDGLLFGVARPAAATYINARGEAAKPRSDDQADNLRARLIRVSTDPHTKINSYVLQSGRFTYDGLRMYLQKNRPKGQVVLHLADKDGKMYHSLKFPAWGEAAEYLEPDNPSAIHLPSKLIRFNPLSGNQS